MRVLDVCCGGRMFWFDKINPHAVFCDIRRESHVLCDGRNFEVSPLVQSDFQTLPFPANHFDLVVFDPPHLVNAGSSSWMAKKYGRLEGNWQEMIRNGFSEAMRVLRPGATLIFKWSENQIKVSEVIRAIGAQPLFGHTTSKTSIWLAFLKEPA